MPLKNLAFKFKIQAATFLRGSHILAVQSMNPFVVAFLGAIFLTFLNRLKQILLKNDAEPPIIPYWIPFIGNAVAYGKDPYEFLFDCRRKYGDVFTFILLGKKMTVCLGTHGNDFILNARLQDANAEEIYTRLTTPVFGSGVVYDCSNAKLMEQKKFLKFGLTTEALDSYVPLITKEYYDYRSKSDFFQGHTGIFPVTQIMAEITIFTASRTLQGREVREKFDSTFAELYHDLDMGFTPINFILPWFPLPANRKRDRANQILSQTYVEIIRERRKVLAAGNETDKDMIWNLMSARYKDGNSIPDDEIAHMMIALLMAGQHSSSSVGSWILLRLASRPDIMDQLYEEQVQVLGPNIHLPPTHDDIRRLSLNSMVVKETLRLHAPIHSIMRAVKSPLQINTPDINAADTKTYCIPTSHTLLSAPGVTATSSTHFPNPTAWDPHRWSRPPPTLESRDDEKIDYGYGLVTKGARSPYLPFGAGRHRCIGEQFAYLQLGTITALMAREFRFRSVRSAGGTCLPRTDYTSLFSRPMLPAMVEWERRDGGGKGA